MGTASKSEQPPQSFPRHSGKRRCFVANFDYEQFLAGNRTGTGTDAGFDGSGHRSLSMAALCTDLSRAWLAVAADGDQILCPHRWPDRSVAELAERGLPNVSVIDHPRHIDPDAELIPWGWTAEMLRIAGHHDIEALAEAYRRANHRARSELLPGSIRFRTVDELRAVLQTCDPDRRWVIKASFGMSGRERILWQGPNLSPQTEGWLASRSVPAALSDDLPFVWEPWVERLAEVSWHATGDGTGFKFDGLAEVLTDRSGRPLGNRVGAVSEPPFDLDRALISLAERLPEYHGPISVDAMRYRADDGSERWRIFQDINARWSMGRIALAAHDRWGTVGGVTETRQWIGSLRESDRPPGRFVDLSEYAKGSQRNRIRIGVFCLQSRWPQ